MLHQKLRSLTDHCTGVFDTGSTEDDFRARLIGGLAVTFSILLFVLVVDDIAAGYYSRAALLSLLPAGMSVALWFLLIRHELDTSSTILVGSALLILALALFLSGGSLSGAFVAVPLLVLLASILCARSVAVLIAVASVLIVGIAVWLSTTDFDFPLARDQGSTWLLGRVAIVTALITLAALLLYRTSAEEVRSQATQAQRNLEATNSELSSVLAAQLASAQLMFKVQEIGALIGWWYEVSTGKVHYTSTEDGEFYSFSLDDRADKAQAAPLDNTNLLELVATRVENTQSWDDEAKVEDSENNLVWYRDSGEVEVDEVGIVRVVGVLQDITSTKTLTDQLELHANFDELTGLCNRRMFWKALAAEHADYDKRDNISHLLYIDLDQFKLVNDTSGHVAGDRLLQIVARVLQQNVHASDIVGRVGGDEFGIIIRNCDPSMVTEIADRLREAIELVHFHWSGETFRVGASVGGIGIHPDNGSAEELQQLVDAACYEAKLAGRNRVNFFEGGEEVIAAHRGEARWVQRLHDAMTHNRFELHGQLIKAVADTGEPDRYEVLIRLRDSESDRLIPPGAFLPAAERFGLSPQVDQWVLEHLLRRLHADPEIHSMNRRYWVNLSGNSIGDRKFAEYLVETMRNSTLPAGMVNFEITETAVIRNIEDASELISKLRAMGCQFALDDFGSGLSSFGYLKKLPVDYLKIDGMFVREILNDEADRVFVQAIISIAQAMGIKTVAEFVENDEIYKLVEGFGVDYVQGYGVHRPEKLAFYESPPVLGSDHRKAG